MLNAQGIDDSLYVFDFEMNHIPIPERTKLLADQGFKGVTFAINNEEQVQKLLAYLQTEEVKSGKFTVPIVYMVYQFGKEEELDVIWKKVLAIAPGSPLWVIVQNRDKQATEEKTLKLFRKMSSMAQKTGSDIVIYPHDNTFIESAEEALPYIEKTNIPNLFLTLHLCHELRAGNGDRLLDVAIQAAPHLKFASISGSNRTMIENDKGNWSDAIKPLDEGDYDIERFVSVLQKIKFRGKTVLHTFGIKQDAVDHLSRSMAKWKEMVQSTYSDLNDNLNHILDAPENAYWDKTSKTWFISNLGGEKVTIEKDGYGWITRLNEKREVISNRWVEGLDAPTGMASYKDMLYVADRGVLVEIDIKKEKIIRKINLPGAQFVNDVAASSNGDIYISDTFTDRIYRLSKKGKLEVFIENSKLEYPNGLWVDGEHLIVATWGKMTNRDTFETSRKGTLLKINLKTKEISTVGKGVPIANFDGVVKYRNFYYATDWTGGRLLQISEEGDVKEIITGFDQFSDLGIDVEKGIILIPEMSKNRFIMLNLNSLQIVID